MPHPPATEQGLAGPRAGAGAAALGAHGNAPGNGKTPGARTLLLTLPALCRADQDEQSFRWVVGRLSKTRDFTLWPHAARIAATESEPPCC
ncbi:hypothetical protein IP84_06190 [beta proteobacterium AAP99]|nr:hypothetical protein IP84_06190 [beta proteobacterium AAP99]